MHAKCAKFAFQSLAFMRSLNFESKENNVEKVSMDQMRARSRQTKTPKHFMVNISNNHVRAAQFLSARLKVREFCRKQNNAITIHAMKYISHKFKYKVKTTSCCCCCCYTIQLTPHSCVRSQSWTLAHSNDLYFQRLNSVQFGWKNYIYLHFGCSFKSKLNVSFWYAWLITSSLVSPQKKTSDLMELPL